MTHLRPRQIESALLTLALFAGCSSRAKEPRFEKEPEVTKQRAAQPVEPTHAPSNSNAYGDDAAVAGGGGGRAAENSANDAAANVAATVDAAPPASAAATAPPVFVRNPTSPDPLGGKFALKDALKGLPAKGTLTATIDTGFGTIECKLFEKETPNTVANFVGLARGLRPFWDAKSAAWVKRPTFDQTSFHRAIDGFMIQGGDHLGDGTGGVGYEIPDELVKGWSHDRAGLLCMANRGPNTNGGQFFITDAAAPHLTQMGTYTIFGECAPLDVIHRIASAPRPSPHSERPEPPVPIKSVKITRK